MRPMPLARFDAPFEHPDWIFEPKMDGFRAVAYVEDGACRLVIAQRKYVPGVQPPGQGDPPGVLAEPEWRGRLTPVDLRALSPLKWQHVNPYGTFTLNMQTRLPLEGVAPSPLPLLCRNFGLR